MTPDGNPADDLTTTDPAAGGVREGEREAKTCERCNTPHLIAREEALCERCKVQRMRLANYLSTGVSHLRLDRIGEPHPDNPVPLERFPEDEQQTWLDIAKVVESLYGLVHFP